MGPDEFDTNYRWQMQLMERRWVEFEGDKDFACRYKEDVFMLRNPFLPADAKPDNCLVPFLVLGGTCSQCEKTVCVDPSCSIFCHKRYCLSCVKLHQDKLPEAVVKECRKRDATKDPTQWTRTISKDPFIFLMHTYTSLSFDSFSWYLFLWNF